MKRKNHKNLSKSIIRNRTLQKVQNAVNMLLIAASFKSLQFNSYRILDPIQLPVQFPILKFKSYSKSTFWLDSNFIPIDSKRFEFLNFDYGIRFTITQVKSRKIRGSRDLINLDFGLIFDRQSDHRIEIAKFKLFWNPQE